MSIRTLYRSVTLGVALALSLPAVSGAQVNKIDLDIAGYLCGF